MKISKILITVLTCVVLCTGCGSKNNTTISYVEAKEKIINENAILLDVRTQEEYENKHIDGAQLLTLDSINEQTAGSIIESKEKIVIVYCQSGNRSSQAVRTLKELGYENVYDFGSIDNWEE